MCPDLTCFQRPRPPLTSSPGSQGRPLKARSLAAARIHVRSLGAAILHQMLAFSGFEPWRPLSCAVCILSQLDKCPANLIAGCVWPPAGAAGGSLAGQK